MNRVRFVLSMRCMFPKYSLEPKLNMPDFEAMLVFHVTVGSIVTISFITNGCSHWKNQFDEKKQN